ncbi:MAG TPA: RNA polymerase sigma factor [Polyangia bacterium]|jgi:RNA polymerase sigma-70 factor (ECF subfamily)|nr:RNA polymerase sigma factor [Polyangia bacterium]
METSRQDCKAPFDFVIPLQPQLLSRARYLAGNEADANDLVQDTFERALRSERAPANTAELRPWLMRVLTNLWIDRVRSQAVRRTVPFMEETMGDVVFSVDNEGAEQDRWRRVSVADVAAALEQVPEPYQTAFRKHVFEHKTYAEIADELGVRAMTIGTRILRARRCIRRILVGRLATEMLPARRLVA